MEAIKLQDDEEDLLYQSAHCTECSEMTGISAKFMESSLGNSYTWSKLPIFLG